MRSLRHPLVARLLALLPFSHAESAAAFQTAPATSGTPGTAVDPSRPQITQTPDEELFNKSLEAAAQAMQVYGAWDNPDALARVAGIGYRVAREAHYSEFPISFFLAVMA